MQHPNVLIRIFTAKYRLLVLVFIVLIGRNKDCINLNMQNQTTLCDFDLLFFGVYICKSFTLIPDKQFYIVDIHCIDSVV